MKKESFNQEFKDTAVKLALTGNKSMSAVAKELGIEKWRLYDWVKTQRKRDKKQPATVPKSNDSELKELQRRNKELELELEILKKAAGYFARTLL